MKQHHPDKSNEENAEEVFKKIVRLVVFGSILEDDDSQEWETNEEGDEKAVNYFQIKGSTFPQNHHQMFSFF